MERVKELLRMSELARASGVPAATIKHYLREGLLPEPTLRTSRNMAYYHPTAVARVRAIKELQQRRFLPLRVIREVLDGADPEQVQTFEAELAKALDAMAGPESRSRAELLAAGMPAEQLDFFCQVGVVTPQGKGAAQRFGGDDLALLRTLGAARRAGIDAQMLPHTILARYLQSISELTRVELELFRGALAGVEPERLPSLVAAATKLSERLVVLLRRKLLLPTLRRLTEPPKKARAARRPASTRRESRRRSRRAQ
jgi:DNA-binding transcriptional MerR regulator